MCCRPGAKNVQFVQIRVLGIVQIKQSSKSDFFVKNRLTNQNESAIICKLSTSGARVNSGHEKVFKKTFVKPLDKAERLWYNTKAVRTKASAAEIDH